MCQHQNSTAEQAWILFLDPASEESAIAARAVATTYLAPAPTGPWHEFRFTEPEFISIGNSPWSEKKISAMLDGCVLVLIAGRSSKHTSNRRSASRPVKVCATSSRRLRLELHCRFHHRQGDEGRLSL